MRSQLRNMYFQDTNVSSVPIPASRRIVEDEDIRIGYRVKKKKPTLTSYEFLHESEPMRCKKNPSGIVACSVFVCCLAIIIHLHGPKLALPL